MVDFVGLGLNVLHSRDRRSAPGVRGDRSERCVNREASVHGFSGAGCGHAGDSSGSWNRSRLVRGTFVLGGDARRVLRKRHGGLVTKDALERTAQKKGRRGAAFFLVLKIRYSAHVWSCATTRSATRESQLRVAP